MLKVVYMSDSHLGFDYPIRRRTQRKNRGADFFINFEKVLAYCLDEKADVLIHTGDLFFRSNVSQIIIDKAYQLLFDFAEKRIPTFIVPGNHERSHLPISFFLEHPYLNIFDRPRTYLIEIKGKKLAISGLPNIRNGAKTEFTSIVNNFNRENDPADIRLLCLHQVIAGARVGPSSFRFHKGPDSIDPSSIPTYFDAVLCGHIHRQQILWQKTSDGYLPIIFAGSTERTSFAERNETKGFYLLEFQDKHLTPKFITLPTRTMIDIDLRKMTDKNQIEKIISRATTGINLDSLIRFRVDNPNIFSFLNREYLREFLPDSVHFQISSQISKTSVHYFQKDRI